MPRRVSARALLGALCTVVAAGGCGSGDSSTESSSVVSSSASFAVPRPAPPLRPERPTVPTDADLQQVLEWQRDWKRLVNRHRAELEVLAGKMATQPAESWQHIASDPVYLADHERRAAEQRAHYARRPTGLMASALETTISALGRMVFGPMAVAYQPGRNDSLVAAARAKYGDAFVDWVLAREGVVVQTLGQ